MSFAARLIHRVDVVSRTWNDTTPDPDGQPVETLTTVANVAALLQPKRASEMEDYRSAGVVIADHVMFMMPQSLDGAAYVVYGSQRYDVTGVREFAFGRSPHLEVDLRRIGPITETVAVVEEGS